MFANRSKATISAYAGLDLDLPNGESVTGRVPTLRRALYFLGLMERAQGGDAKASLTMVAEFPKEVGLEEALNRLTLEEFWEVVGRFFTRRRPRSPAASSPDDRAEDSTT